MSKQIDNIPPATLKGRGFNVATMGDIMDFFNEVAE